MYVLSICAKKVPKNIKLDFFFLQRLNPCERLRAPGEWPAERLRAPGDYRVNLKTHITLYTEIVYGAHSLAITLQSVFKMGYPVTSSRLSSA